MLRPTRREGRKASGEEILGASSGHALAGQLGCGARAPVRPSPPHVEAGAAEQPPLSFSGTITPFHPLLMPGVSPSGAAAAPETPPDLEMTRRPAPAHLTPLHRTPEN